MKKTENGVSNKDIYIDNDGRSEILAFNFSDLCPPFCTTGIPPFDNNNLGIDLENIGVSIIQNGDKLIVL